MSMTEFRAAFRRFRRRPILTAVTIGGVASGLAAALLLLNYVAFETSYDRWVPDADRVVRIETTVQPPGQPPTATVTAAGALAPALASAGGPVTATVRLFEEQTPIRMGDRLLRLPVVFSDPGLPDFFGLGVVAGDPNALSRPDQIALTETAVQTLLGAGPQTAVGRTLLLNGVAHRVALVLEDVPPNSHLSLQVLASLESPAFSNRSAKLEDWGALSGYTYARLAPGASPQDVERAARTALDRYGPPPPIAGGEPLFAASARPLPAIHLSPEAALGGFKPPADLPLITAFGIVAALILLMATFNFVSLSTVAAVARTREIALRKTVGAKRSQLIGLFAAEALIIAGMAVVIGLAIYELAGGPFATLVDRPLVTGLTENPKVILWAGGLMLAITAMACLYPASRAYRAKTAQALAGRRGAGRTGAMVWKTIAILQLACAIGVTSLTLVVVAQGHFLRTRDLGFDTRSVLVVPELPSDGAQVSTQTLVEALRANSAISDVALSSDLPGAGENRSVSDVQVPGQARATPMDVQFVDPAMFALYGFEVVAGRLPEQNTQADLDRIVLSRSALRALGLGDAAGVVGRPVLLGGTPHEVLAVVEDVRWYGPATAAPALVYKREADRMRALSVRPAAGRVAEAETAVRTQLQRAFPDAPAEYLSLDDRLDRDRVASDRRGDLFVAGSWLAILIATIGVYGLTGFLAAQRGQEIAIRRTVGAPTSSIILLFLRSIAVLAALAAVVALPLWWLAARWWLSQTAETFGRPEPLFLGGVLLVSVLCLGAATLQTWRPARAKPAHTLRRS